MTKLNRAALVGVAVLVTGAFGCATTKQVDKKIAEATAKTDQKIETVETQVEELQTKQKETETKVEAQGQEIVKVSQAAQEALKRAQEAGILAKGQVVFEQTFTEDRVKFRTGSAVSLSLEAMDALRAHCWPGNVRELMGRVRRAAVTAEQGDVQPGDLGFSRTERRRQRRQEAAPGEAVGAGSVDA